MTERRSFDYYLHLRDGALMCSGCLHAFPTYRALAHHQFQGTEPCVPTALAPTEVVLPDPAREFAGIPTAVPHELPGAGDLAEHRDAKGRLRVVGTLTGYRRWAVGRVDGRFRLFPLFAKRDGRGPYARGVTTAYCGADAWEKPHRSPDPGCTCGLYAFWAPADADSWLLDARRATVLGRVDAWGKVLPGTKGFRSEFAMVDALATPTCIASGCSTASTRFICRPRWINPLTPGGRRYPRVNDRRHDSYRDTADFSATLIGSPYLGWYCDDHAQADLGPPSHRGSICNYPTADSKRCLRPSAFVIRDVSYSWCAEHAPLIFDTASVMAGLTAFHDADAVMGFGSEALSPVGQDSRSS